MAKVLAEGGFVTEALAIRWDWKTATPIPIDLIDANLVKKGLMPDEILSLVACHPHQG